MSRISADVEGLNKTMVEAKNELKPMSPLVKAQINADEGKKEKAKNAIATME